MSLTWNFCLILFLFLSLGVFPSGSLANQKKKKKEEGLNLTETGFELATQKESIMNVKKRKRMLYFALREGPKPSPIESSNLGIVLLQVIGSWLRAKLGGQSHEEAAEADHMGDGWGPFTMKFCFIYYTVEMYLCHFEKPSQLIGWEFLPALTHQLFDK